jgi:hypothetical protein
MTRLLAAVLLAAPGLAAASPAGPESHYALPAAGRGLRAVLHNGQEVDGVLLRVSDGTAWIGVDQGEIGLDLADIADARPRGGGTAEFRRRLSLLSPSDAAALWALAVWADASALPSSAREAARMTVSAEPGHRDARAFLGEELVGGRWLPHDEAMVARGYVEDGNGVWITRVEAASRAKTRAEAAERERARRESYELRAAIAAIARLETGRREAPQPQYAVSGWLLPGGSPRLRGKTWPPAGDYVLPMRHGQAHAPFITRRTE